MHKAGQRGAGEAGAALAKDGHAAAWGKGTGHQALPQREGLTGDAHCKMRAALRAPTHSRVHGPVSPCIFFLILSFIEVSFAYCIKFPC